MSGDLPHPLLTLTLRGKGCTPLPSPVSPERHKDEAQDQGQLQTPTALEEALEGSAYYDGKQSKHPNCL